MKSPTVSIVGFGVVGKHMAKMFPEAYVVDPAIKDATPPEMMVDIAFICVPTPPKADGSCDTSIVEQAIRENDAEIYVVKSTVPPTTCQRFAETMDKNIVFSPEYQGETINANGYEYPFVILGGDPWTTRKIAEVYKHLVTGEFRIIETDAKTAELAKYMENAFLAVKLTFCHEFAELALNLGIDYDKLREVWLQDPRIGRAHTQVFAGQSWWDSKCLNKDVPAINVFAHENKASLHLVEAAIYSNALRRDNDKI